MKVYIQDNKITLVIVDEVKYKKEIMDKVAVLCDNDINDYAIGMRDRIVSNIVDQSVLDTIIKEVELEGNKPYIAELKVGDEMNRYMVTKVDHTDIPSGYTISKTMR